MASNNNLALIPARGGSRRIPKKNIKSFLGKPVIAYSIELARSSGFFSEIMVSTDDDEIAKVSRSLGANIPFFRSARSAGDHATLNDVLLETQDAYREKGKSFEYICLILPTAPLIQGTTFEESFRLLISEGYDSVRPVVKYAYPIQRAFRMIDHKIERIQPEYNTARSQDLEPAYHDAGQFYWINRDRTLEDEYKGGVLISETQAQDMDYEEDWVIAEMKYKLMHGLQ